MKPEAAAVSAFQSSELCGRCHGRILYGFGSWPECMRILALGSAAWRPGWDMTHRGLRCCGARLPVAAAGDFWCHYRCSYFTALTYALTILGIDNNLQFVFLGRHYSDRRQILDV